MSNQFFGYKFKNKFLETLCCVVVFFALFSGLTHAQTVGSGCSVSGRTQMSATASEGLIQCRSGTWASATQSVAGTQAPAVIQYQKMMITTTDTCNDTNIGFIGYNPSTKVQMVCGGSSVGWSELPTSSGGGSTSSSAPVVVPSGSTVFTSGGSPNYCTQLNGTTGQGTPINYLKQCSANGRCSNTGTCDAQTLSWSNLAVGAYHVCSIHQNGDLFCWGGGGSNELGNGVNGQKNNPTYASQGSGFTWTSIAAGSTFTCGVRNNSSIACVGAGNHGQRGDGSTSSSSAMTPISGLYKSVTAGTDHACAIRTDNMISCWGRGDNGQLGYGGTTSQSQPNNISGGLSYKMVDAGGYHTCAITTSDSLTCWGRGTNGQLGNGNSSSDATGPQGLVGGGTWKLVSGGSYHTCAIKSDDTLWCWGLNNWGQLGTGNTTSQSSPTSVSGGGTWKFVAAGNDQTCAIKSDDTLLCWGRNDYGQIGDGTTSQRYTPTQVLGGGTWKSVSGSGYGYHTCGIRLDGSLDCWGLNNSGQLGNGTLINRSSPTDIVL